DAVTAVEFLLQREHVHRTALAFGIATATSGEFRHHAFRVHAAGKHVAVIAITGDHLITIAHGELHAHHDGFLTDIEATETANQPHAIHLARLFLEPADQEHLAEREQLLFFRKFGNWGLICREICARKQALRALSRLFGLGDCHYCPQHVRGTYPIAEFTP